MAKKIQLSYKEIEERLRQLKDHTPSADEIGYSLLYAFGKGERDIARMREGKGIIRTFDPGLLIKGEFCYRATSTLRLVAELEDLKADPSIRKAAPKIIAVSDGRTIRAYDTRQQESFEQQVDRLYCDFEFFYPLAGVERIEYVEESPADIKAAEKLAKLHDEKNVGKRQSTSINNSPTIYYYTLDALKLFFCFFVISIHIGVFWSSERSQITTYLQNSAVPFYFIASGFLFAKKHYEGNGILKYSLRYIQLYLIWSLIYAPISFVHNFHTNGSIIKSIVALTRNILLYGQGYLSWSLWYLHALIIAFLIIYILRKKHVSYLIITIVGFLLYFLSNWLTLHRLDSTLSPVTQATITAIFKIFVGVRFLEGMMYVCIGIFLEKMGSKIRSQLIITIAVVALLLSIFDTPLQYAFSGMSICTLGLLWKSKKKQTVFMVVRNLSTLIYFVHLIVLACLLFFNVLGEDSSFHQALFETIVLSTLTSMVIIWMSKYKLLSWLRRLY